MRVRNEYQAPFSSGLHPSLPPLPFPPPGVTADNFSLSGIQLDVAGTCSLLIKLRVAATIAAHNSPSPSLSLSLCLCVCLSLSDVYTRPDNWWRALRPPLAGAYRTERVAFSPLPVARAQTPRFIELSLITRRFNYHGELTAEPMAWIRSRGVERKTFLLFLFFLESFWKYA